MTVEKKEDGETNPEIVKLQEQIENLNKGIASYRDQANQSEADKKAMRSEIEELKKLTGELKELGGKSKKDEDTKLSQEDQKKFDALMKEKGIVTKDEMEAEKARMFNENIKNIENQAISEFLEKHPEYDGDDEWKQIADEFALYKMPTSLTGFRNLLNKIHRDLSGSDDKAKAKAKAEIIKRQQLELGGGSQKSGDQDFEKQVEDYQKKYPNLSREQIEGRLAEINTLTKEKK